MRNKMRIRQFGIIAVIAIIGFAIGILSFTGCKNGTTFVRNSGGGNGGSGGDSSGGNGVSGGDSSGGNSEEDLVFKLTVRGVQNATALTFDRVLTWEWEEILFTDFFEDPSKAGAKLTADGVFTLTLPAIKSSNLASVDAYLPGLTPSPTYGGRLCMIEPYFGAGPMDAYKPDWIHCFVDNYTDPYLIFADKAGTVTGSRATPYDPDRTEIFNLVLKKGWNTVMSSADNDLEIITYETADWPSHDSWLWQVTGLK